MSAVMQSTRFIPLIAVAVVFGGGGYFLGRQSEPSSVDVPTPAKPVELVKAPPSPAPSGSLPASLVRLLGDEAVTSANAAALTFRALEEGDPVTRMAATMILLESMTAENALAIRQAFLDITKQTGRRADAEWALMVRRCGTMLGAEALKVFAADKSNVALAVEGFAFANPDTALAACKAAGLKGPQITNAWLTGVCRKDPNKALSLALSGEYGDINGTGLFNQAIQSAGVDGAIEAMQHALDADPDNAPSSEAFPKLFEGLAGALQHKHITNNTPGEMLKWFEKQKGQPYLTDKLLSNAAFETLTKGSPVEAIGWMVRMNADSEGPPVGTARLFDAVHADPKILTGLDEAFFSRLLPLMDKEPLKLLALAAMIEEENPARGNQIRALIPAAPATVPPVPSPTPGGQ